MQKGEIPLQLYEKALHNLFLRMICLEFWSTGSDSVTSDHFFTHSFTVFVLFFFNLTGLGHFSSYVKASIFPFYPIDHIYEICGFPPSTCRKFLL